MKINIKRYFLPLAAVLFMVGCHEAVEPEAIDVNYSSFEETNPELYARYMQALREDNGRSPQGGIRYDERS